MPAACILNSGGGAWAFASLADQLSRALWLDVAQRPYEFNYLLHCDEPTTLAGLGLFISTQSMVLAADKRRLAEVSVDAGVPIPETHLLDSPDRLQQLLNAEPRREWCVKYPTGCGAAGHRLLSGGLTLPESWPRPLVVQEFIRLEKPEVYRTYAAGGQVFGWVVRRFPQGVAPSPWVAHARGARYQDSGQAPPEALAAAKSALQATGLLPTFGCVDLLQRPSGEWVVLEVGTDGLFNHVDRELGLPAIEEQLQRFVAEAFWARLGEWRPWGIGPWRARE